MAAVKHIRASDTIDLNDLRNTGFVVRKRSGLKQIYSLCVMAILIALGGTILLFNEAWIGAMLCVVVGSVTLDLGRNLERQQKMLKTTEFINALFASALGKKHTFCAIVRLDGRIIYMNGAFQEIFPDFIGQAKYDLETLLTMGNVSSDKRQSLISLVAKNTENVVPITMEITRNKAPQSMTLSIEPIERPSGFVLLRAQ